MDRLIQQTIADLMKLHTSADEVGRKCIERILQKLHDVNIDDFKVSPPDHSRDNTSKT
jgi:hypothetical protein